MWDGNKFVNKVSRYSFFRFSAVEVLKFLIVNSKLLCDTINNIIEHKITNKSKLLCPYIDKLVIQAICYITK